ncbi:hypothetical protein FV220_20675 [Methylobacterium sp. WL19]|nr:hypothetical protein FV220_20675 [Methylobacterium sp. WL19]
MPARPHPEVPERSGGLEGALQFAQWLLEPSFEAATRRLRMRSWVRERTSLLGGDGKPAH